MEGSNNQSHQEDTLINVLSGGKKFIDISEKGIDFNFLGFSAGIDVLAESKPKSVLGGLKAKVSTPWGSTASAGFEGNLGPTGLGGGLSARAALTPDIAAKAGLEGNINTKGINGGVKAGAKSPISGEHIAQLSGEQAFKRSE